MRQASFISKLAVLALVAPTFTIASQIVTDWNPDWNYEQGGADWAFTNCNNTKQQ